MAARSLRLFALSALLWSCKDKGDDSGDIDADGDGFPASVDCDYGGSDGNPHAAEAAANVDNDCAG